MKPASEKQIDFARKINNATNKPLPAEKTAYAYFIYIRDNIEEYKEIRARQRSTIRTFRRSYKRKYYNSPADEEQDASWAAAMDFSWM